MSKVRSRRDAPQVGADPDDNLPDGWASSRLGDGLVLDIQPGFPCGAHNRCGQGVAHLRPMNISREGQIDFKDLKFVPSDAASEADRWVRAGDVLFNNTNSPELVGKTAVYDLPEPRAFSNHITRIKVRENVLDPRYCAVTLHAKWQSGYFQATCNNHVSQASVSRETLLDTEIPLPPIAEQKRIVARVAELSAHVDAARERLAKVPAILKRFRQAVLAAACSGRLTEDWREQNPDVEAGVHLLDRIRATGPVSNRRPHRVADVAGEFVPELPQTWGTASLDAICANIVGCPHSTPKWTAFGRLCVRTENFRPRSLDLTEKSYVSEETYQTRTARLVPMPADILYSREGGILGIACMIPPGVTLCLGQRMMLLRPHAELSSAFYMNILNSEPILQRVRELTGGTASPHLNVADIKSFPVPVPPASEQAEIVCRVGTLFKLADTIEQRVAAAARADKLTQSILARAFRGELVPTEAELARQEGRDYEPASAVLERSRGSNGKTKQGELFPTERRGRRRRT